MAALMLAGTGSDVGKSLLAAGLCRAYRRRGLRVRPFKPQNMSNNAAVSVDGGEIGRAQALQARACGVEPHSDMNPVLLKPQSETGAQVVVQGKVWGSAAGRDYQTLKPRLLTPVLESFARLRDVADLVVVEGAGSISEVNLRAADIANMGFAEATATPVVLVGDIDRGGVIASIVGSHCLLSATERSLLKGYVINKFRGDVGLFDGGLRAIGERTGLRSFGVVRYFADAARLPAEDALGVGVRAARRRGDSDEPLHVVVPTLSRLANFDDLDPLLAEDGVRVSFIAAGRALPGDADLVVLPGSKSTLADLRFLKSQGWDIDVRAHLRRGGWLLGLCGGLQMLGRSVDDPQGIEGAPGQEPGLGLLDFATELRGAKILRRAHGVDNASGETVRGYEMHIGRSAGPALARPMLTLDGRADGAVSADGRIAGCYLHGLFGADGFRRAFLRRLGGRGGDGDLAYEQSVERALDALADHLERDLDLDALLELAA